MQKRVLLHLRVARERILTNTVVHFQTTIPPTIIHVQNSTLLQNTAPLRVQTIFANAARLLQIAKDARRQYFLQLISLLCLIHPSVGAHARPAHRLVVIRTHSLKP